MADAAGHTLLARLQALRAAPEPLAALLADLRGIEHGGDPRFAMTLDHYLESWLGNRPREVFRLAGPRLVVLAPAEAGDLLDAGAKALARTLHSHGFGDLRTTRYDVAADVERMIADLYPGDDRAAALREAAERAPTAALAHLLEVERVLHGADLDSLVREQPIWSFAGAVPTVPATELAVSLTELESRLSLPLRRDAWLRHEVAVRLDRGLLRHIARDRAQDPRPFTVDLHTTTVLDDGFDELARAIPAEARRRVTAELACWELSLAPDRVAAAAARLADAGFGVALDHVPLATLATLDPAGIEPVFIKAHWIRGAADAASHLTAAVARFGAGRLVLWRCDEPAALETGRAAGVTLLQGRAADAAAAAPHTAPLDSERPRREEDAAADEPTTAADTDQDATTTPARPGLFGRLFGRG
ncbi:hypothetical protein [Azospirillum sp. TSO35-2]|uniref:hypothetical protein n=1 Tax=Azospirillum sp. TSO35-2 TaxID=716796 RepID=UPI000D613D54|nr:hypothetical protein [Azospirillum sp. TSO35-2]PWC32992.1 hypothetical protein TSO352_20725 [Azospirillum sp. TSO35-2]